MTNFHASLTGAALAAALVVGGTGGASAHSSQSVHYRPLTVDQRHAPRPYAPQRRAYDPYSGPGVIVTGPVHLAGTLATAPFRAINTVFPARSDTPLVLVGGPVYVAGRLVELPFRLVEAPFGGPAPFQD